MSMPDYTVFVKSRLDAGDSPNQIEIRIREALLSLDADWVLVGDNVWRLDMVCAVCGDDEPHLCGHRGQKPPILRREFEAKGRLGCE